MTGGNNELATMFCKVTSRNAGMHVSEWLDCSVHTRGNVPLLKQTINLGECETFSLRQSVVVLVAAIRDRRILHECWPEKRPCNTKKCHPCPKERWIMLALSISEHWWIWRSYLSWHPNSMQLDSTCTITWLVKCLFTRIKELKTYWSKDTGPDAGYVIGIPCNNSCFCSKSRWWYFWNDSVGKRSHSKIICEVTKSTDVCLWWINLTLTDKGKD